MSRPVPQLTWHTPWGHAFPGPPPGFFTALQSWLPDQRWFLTKDTGPLALNIDQAIPLHVEDQTVWWLLLRVTRPGHPAALYQLPLALLDLATTPRAVIAHLEGLHLL